jgi:hypothetical protein
MGLMDLGFGATNDTGSASPPDTGSVSIAELDWGPPPVLVSRSEIKRLRQVEREAEARIAVAQLERDYWRRRAADLDAEIELLRPGSRRPSASFWLGADGAGRA